MGVEAAATLLWKSRETFFSMKLMFDHSLCSSFGELGCFLYGGIDRYIKESSISNGQHDFVEYQEAQ